MGFGEVNPFCSGLDLVIYLRAEAGNIETHRSGYVIDEEWVHGMQASVLVLLGVQKSWFWSLRSEMSDMCRAC